METSTSGYDGIMGTTCILLPEPTLKLDKKYETIVLKTLDTMHQKRVATAKTGNKWGEPSDCASLLSWGYFQAME